MNCPSCGVSVDADQEFCRSCGAALAADPSSIILPRTLVLISVLVIFAGIIVGVTGGMAELRWLKYTGIYILLFGFLSLVGGNLILQRILETRTRWRIAEAKAERRKPQTAGPPTIERADTTNKLLPVGENDFVPPSVADHTTELLKQPSRKE